MNFNQIIKFAKYKIFARHKNAYGIHSPLVFDLITNVFNDKSSPPFYREIEAVRKDLLSSEEMILQNDFGALKRKRKGQKSVGELAKNSLKAKKYSQLLNKIVNYYNYKNILEIGTSFGITTSYLNNNNKVEKIITIEGCENISKIAKRTFEKLNYSNIKLINNKFDNVLENIVSGFSCLDLVFFDGNHEKNSTLKYFNICIEQINNNSVFVFDDIYWSKGMESAWKTIINDNRSVITIDLFSIGLVFFKENTEKQHFVIRY